jgi:hypothetical protein
LANGGRTVGSAAAFAPEGREEVGARVTAIEIGIGLVILLAVAVLLFWLARTRSADLPEVVSRLMWKKRLALLPASQS